MLTAYILQPSHSRVNDSKMIGAGQKPHLGFDGPLATIMFKFQQDSEVVAEGDSRWGFGDDDDASAGTRFRR